MVGFVPQRIEPELAGWINERPWWARLEGDLRETAPVGGVAAGRIIDALRRVYGASAMATMAAAYERSLVIALHALAARFEVSAQLLGLGVDLCRVPPGTVARDMPTRLQRAVSWWGARLEIGVAAGLAAAGCGPRRPPRSKDETQHDFDVDTAGARVALECKSLSEGTVGGNARIVRELVENYAAITRQRREFVTAHFATSASLRDALGLPPEEFMVTHHPSLAEAVRQGFESAVLDERAVPCGSYGSLVLTTVENPNGFALVDGVGEEGAPGRELRRLVQIVRDAGRQLRGARDASHRAAVVWVGDDHGGARALCHDFGAVVGKAVGIDRRLFRLTRDSIGVDSVVLLRGGRGLRPASSGRVEAMAFAMDGSVPPLPAEVLRGVAGWRELAHLDMGAALPAAPMR